MKAKIDIKYLQNLLGSKTATAQFIELFKKESAELTANILLFFKAKDFKNLSIAAHGLKSHLRYVNLLELADIAQKIEHECERENQHPEFENWILDFEKQIKMVID